MKLLSSVTFFSSFVILMLVLFLPGCTYDNGKQQTGDQYEHTDSCYTDEIKLEIAQDDGIPDHSVPILSDNLMFLQGGYYWSGDYDADDSYLIDSISVYFAKASEVKPEIVLFVFVEQSYVDDQTPVGEFIDFTDSSYLQVIYKSDPLKPEINTEWNQFSTEGYDKDLNIDQKFWIGIMFLQDAQYYELGFDADADTQDLAYMYDSENWSNLQQSMDLSGALMIRPTIEIYYYDYGDEGC